MDPYTAQMEKKDKKGTPASGIPQQTALSPTGTHVTKPWRKLGTRTAKWISHMRKRSTRNNSLWVVNDITATGGMIDGTYPDTVITGKDPSSDKESVLALQLRKGSEGDTYLRKQSDSVANAGAAGRDTHTGMVTMTVI